MKTNLIPIKILKDDRNVYIFREESGNLIIQATHVLYILKDIEKEIYNLVNGKNSIENILTEISKIYNVSKKEIKQDILSFLDNLKYKNLITF